MRSSSPGSTSKTSLRLAGVALGASCVGLALLAGALWDASPPVNFGTSEELAGIEDGRRRLLPAAGVLLAAAALYALQRSWSAALIIASPAVVCPLLVATHPGALFGGLAFLLLGLLALGAAAVAAWRRRQSAEAD